MTKAGYAGGIADGLGEAAVTRKVLACEWDFSKEAPEPVKRFCYEFRKRPVADSAMAHKDLVSGDHAPAPAAVAEACADYIVGSDVLYSEALIDPLLQGISRLMGPGSVAILANERRCEETYAAFLRACRVRFRGFRLVPRRQMPEDAPDTMYIVELRRPNQ